MLIQGQIHSWGIKKSRRYMVVTLPYEQARKAFKAEVYSVKDGRGEQRDNKRPHVKYLQKEIAEDRFTPTVVHVSLRDKHRSLLTTQEVDGVVMGTIDLGEDRTLPLTNGSHRNSAIANLIHDGVEAANQLPVTALILIDGDPKVDFLNLQKSKSVDAAHMLSLKIQTRTVGGKYSAVMEHAMKTAKFFDGHADNPFAKQIRFDSRSVKSLPFSRLCKTSTAEILCSFAGLSTVSCGIEPQTLSQWLIKLMKHVEAECPELIDEGQLLQPPPDGKYVTLWLGLLTLLVYRVQFLEREEPHLEDLDAFVRAANESLNVPINSITSTEHKRVYLRLFASGFFQDLETQKHCGVPLELVKTLNASCMGLEPLPREKSPKVNGPTLASA